ncbi:substrate-binding domain-containing protein [Geminicoccus flavidas]|uniref:substrate-binding domain-containing protein n=1 Tax=Geminicoccus flavidas TaxID=2506407 RepID=UPI00135B1759|nr:substrate-binding domain-containing protein [Geminicoccus flavidas]
MTAHGARRTWLAALGGLAGLALVTGMADGAAAQSLADLPEELQALYTDGIPVGPSAYDEFQMPAKPWRWCHSESYMGNPWRVSAANELKRLVENAKAQGLVSEFEMSDSNGDVTQQIAQVRAFIDKGCSVITMIAGSSTALNDVIEAAYKAGIPVVTTASAVTSPYALNIQHNHNVWGYNMGNGIAAYLNGPGNVLEVEGIPGSPIVAQENSGGERAFAEHPDITVLGRVSGNWTANVTKSVVLQFLATNPSPIDAVWTTGSETRVIAEAFEEAGRPVPLITGSMSGDALGYWKEHQDTFKFYGGAILPTVAAQNTYRAATRLLEGQQPIVNTIIVPVPEIKQEDLGKWAAPCMTVESGSIFPVPPADPISETMMDGYFRKGAGTPSYDFASTPDPCG